MEILAKSAFIFYALLIVSGAIMAVAAHSIVRSLVGLIGSMFGVAGMYLLLAAPFIAFMQILIYVGGVSVLIFFAIMLTSASAEDEEPSPYTFRRHLYAVLAMLAPAVTLSWVIIKYPPETFSAPETVGPLDLGKGMLSHYLLPFELISIVLFVAMAGAVLLAWQKWGKK